MPSQTLNRCFWVIILGGSLAACGPRERCSLDFERLREHKASALVYVGHSADTLSVVSGGRLIWAPLEASSLAGLDSTQLVFRNSSRQLYNRQVPVRIATYEGALELAMTDANVLPYALTFSNRWLAPGPQTLLKARIRSPRIRLANNVRVGMGQPEFLALLFDDLSPEDLSCLADYHVVVNSDPVGEYLKQTFVFRRGYLWEILMEQPEWSRAESRLQHLTAR